MVAAPFSVSSLLCTEWPCIRALGLCLKSALRPGPAQRPASVKTYNQPVEQKLVRGVCQQSTSALPGTT